MPSLHELAHAAGLEPDYKNWRQEPTSASTESILAALRVLAPDLGISVERPDDIPAALATLERAKWNEVVPPVCVGWDGHVVVPFAVPADSDGEWSVEITTESGRTVRANGRLFTLPADAHEWPGGRVHCIRRAKLSLDRELGYHHIAWQCLGASGESFAIAAPTRAYGGPGEGPRRWGVFAPVFGLASAESGQAGDLGTLRRLFDAVGRRGGRYVATLPILAAMLDEPCQYSPYSPVSRLFWNELYLDLGTLAKEVGAQAPSAPPIIADTLIEFRDQYRWRRQALDPIARELLADPVRGGEIDTWAIQNGVYDYAAFRAIGEAQRESWQNWPALLRNSPPPVVTRSDAIALGADGARVTTHVVAQWAMQRQLDGLKAHPVQLYLDLPVGVGNEAYEVWRYRHLFMTELAAGAPPDPLFLGGQNWGLPPLSPIALRRDHYRYFIRCVRHHMRVAGMLRIDHVMGLFRLYCVPHGRPATDGLYVKYNAEELCAILALESQRAKCALVGEDLGTVPADVRPAMARHGMFRLHVGQWFFPAKVGGAPDRSPAEAVASLNTHDTPTFAGWWRGTDIDDRVDLKLINDRQEVAERAEREAQKVALLAYAKPELAHDTLTEVERAMVAATTDLAVGPAEVVLLALDDLALEPVPHNVPGTVYERPNWMRRVAGWSDALDESRASPAAAATIAAMVAARPSRG